MSVLISEDVTKTQQKDQQSGSEQRANHSASTTEGDEKQKNDDGEQDNKPVGTLVVDTNLFIKGLSAEHISNKFVTVPEVIQELRSKASKERYNALDMKYGVKLMNPDAESIQAVRNFAKRTGDFASLALTDMKVIALAAMLEKQKNGLSKLRLEPIGNHPNISDRKLLASAELSDLPKSEHAEKELSQSLEGLSLETAENKTVQNEGEAVDKVVEQKPSNEETNDGWQVAGPKTKKHAPRVDEFFNGGWITPSNVKQHQAADAMGMKQARALNKPSKKMEVACVTADFAMQNVLLKMGINLVTPDGIAVRQLRTWVLRCHACFHLTGDMNRQFCSECGHPTLKHCSVTTAANGRLQVHLKSNYQHNLRGTVYSMPKPRGGRHTTRDVITREDERAYSRAIGQKLRADAKSNVGLGGSSALEDPDYVPDLLLENPLAHANGFGVATDARGMPMVARNRRNPNVVRNTGNRKKKKQHM
ncbi:20S-pre-rRNA D-site endonuclease nob1 [Coemansia sp. RSA 1365]|nr:20S-pre-rRNA D-site endonuclease nob1 [Coemansia sp. RSA 1365]